MPEEMEKGGNPDAAQDEGLIRAVMQESLGPIFDTIGERLKDLEEDLGETRDLLFELCEKLIGAADGHKRTMLSDEISQKYGKDIEPFEGFYKDTQGKGFTDSILEELMGENAPDEGGRDEWMKNKLNEARGKYGKYVGIKAEVEPAAEKAEEMATPGGEAAAEAAESPEKAAEEEAGAPAAGGGAADQIFEQLKSLGGKKRKLSEPVISKAEK